MAIMEEHEAFEAMRDALIADSTTAGKIVLVFGGKLEGVFDNREDAYRSGLKRFGTDVEFLIRHAAEKDPPIMNSWLWGLC